MFTPLRPKDEDVVHEDTGFALVFNVTQAEPQFAKLFLATGGSLNSAAAAGSTDFSLTGSRAALKVDLDNTLPTEVRMELPKSLFSVQDGVLQIGNRSKLNTKIMRLGASISGTLVDTHAGAGSVYLSNLLGGAPHYQVPLTYGATASHSATMAFSAVRIEDAEGKPVSVNFTSNPKEDAILEEAEALVDKWANDAWGLRAAEDPPAPITYNLSRTLTKTVAKVPVGVNDKGYELVHNVINQTFPFGLPALNSIFQNACGVELVHDETDLQNLIRDTAHPGLQAAAWAQTLAAACSTAANFLIAYRADGRTTMGAEGSSFVATESWLGTLTTACEGNDCENSGMVILAASQAALDSTPEEREKYPFVRALRNTIFPYYTPGMAVVAAKAAEASGPGEGDHVAGHGIAMWIDTLGLLSALHKASDGYTVSGKALTDDAALLNETRTKAVFSDEVLDQLPEEERDMIKSFLTTGATPVGPATQLHPFAIEGTTPASPVLYMPDSERRSAVERQADNDARAFAQANPNVGRSFKTLHVGGKNPNDPSRFYHDILEFSLNSKHPFFSKPTLRELKQAASQFVFVQLDRSAAIQRAGATPREMVTKQFGAIPLHSIGTKAGEVLDFAAEKSRSDVIPPRAATMRLTKKQSTDVDRSLEALHNLNDSFSANASGHCVAYILAYSTIVNNPLAVEHFCDRIRSCAKGGVVDFLMVEGIALRHDSDEDAGHFVVVNAVMKV